MIEPQTKPDPIVALDASRAEPLVQRALNWRNDPADATQALRTLMVITSKYYVDTDILPSRADEGLLSCVMYRIERATKRNPAAWLRCLAKATREHFESLGQVSL